MQLWPEHGRIFFIWELIQLETEEVDYLQIWQLTNRMYDTKLEVRIEFHVNNDLKSHFFFLKLEVSCRLNITCLHWLPPELRECLAGETLSNNIWDSDYVISTSAYMVCESFLAWSVHHVKIDGTRRRRGNPIMNKKEHIFCGFLPLCFNSSRIFKDLISESYNPEFPDGHDNNTCLQTGCCDWYDQRMFYTNKQAWRNCIPSSRIISMDILTVVEATEKENLHTVCNDL